MPQKNRPPKRKTRMLLVLLSPAVELFHVLLLLLALPLDLETGEEEEEEDLRWTSSQVVGKGRSRWDRRVRRLPAE
jgi:hypothetical protein